MFPKTSEVPIQNTVLKVLPRTKHVRTTPQRERSYTVHRQQEPLMYVIRSHAHTHVHGALPHTSHLRAPRVFPSISRYSRFKPSDRRRMSANPRACTLCRRGYMGQPRKKRRTRIRRGTKEGRETRVGGLGDEVAIPHTVMYTGNYI